MAVQNRFLVLALGACAVVMPSAHAEEAANEQFQSGMRVYVDPETGRLVSAPVTDEQRAAAAAASTFSQDSSKATEAVATDGSKMFLLNGQFELALSANVDANGELQFGCNDAEHANLLGSEHSQLHAPAGAADER
jgi:hypothetical protein